MKNELLMQGDVFGTQTNISKLNGVTKWAIQREGNEIVKQTIVANIHEQGRALLTHTALENLGALSSLEEQLTELAPSGAERYRHIVDAYAMGAAKKLMRW